MSGPVARLPLFSLLRCLLIAAAVSACSDEPIRSPSAAGDGASSQPDQAAYIGSSACGNCHAREAALWRRSHHAQAMAQANAESVHGDFDQARFDYSEYFAEFFVRDDRYWLRTNDMPRGFEAGDTGVVEYEVLYTFGVEPLQQYLVETRPGNLQAFNIAAATGGEQPSWFDLYSGEQLAPDDPLQWSSELHNWNSRCAACHVTQFEKNFDPATAAYSSEWAQVNVGCEACHGPGSLHAREPAVAMPAPTSIESRWVFADGPIAGRIDGSGQVSPDQQAFACAACHSRRAQLASHEAGMQYLDVFEPAWLTEGLYYADGQILDEVFVYGSFAQSAMHASGVTCSDCHEPHSGELRAMGDALCAGCHRADVFAVADHHRHDQAVQPDCVDCHMPATTYMQVDPRRDHSFRVPRPDLGAALGTPNACNGCHTDRDALWAQRSIEQWFPQGRWRDAHYATALAAGQNWSADRSTQLQTVVYDEAQPSFVRATALRILARQFDGVAIDAVEYATRSSDALLQLAGLQALESAEPQARIRLAQRFLDNDLRVLRVNAARALVGAEAGLSERRRRDFDAAVAEYEATLAFNADTAEGRLAQGLLAARRGDMVAAEQAYRNAIDRNTGFAAAWINLADLLRTSATESEANALLRDALESPAGADAGLHAALGLSYVRLGDNQAAIESLERAAGLAPNDPYHAYSYGLALASIDSRDAALDWLEQASDRAPAYAPILIALATMNRDAGRLEQAREFTRRLLEVSPGDPSGVALERELGLRR